MRIEHVFSLLSFPDVIIPITMSESIDDGLSTSTEERNRSTMTGMDLIKLHSSLSKEQKQRPYKRLTTRNEDQVRPIVENSHSFRDSTIEIATRTD
jgi:hypothetical protein